jgi:hypothetical protein
MTFFVMPMVSCHWPSIQAGDPAEGIRWAFQAENFASLGIDPVLPC